jgi:hypothetical protein
MFFSVFTIYTYKFIEGDPDNTAGKHILTCKNFTNAAIYVLMNDQVEQDLVVFLLEHSGDFLLITRSSVPNHHIRLGLEFASSILPVIEGRNAFRSVLSFEPETIDLIPQIAQIAGQRRQGIDCMRTYATLLDQISRSRSLTTSYVLDGREVAIAIKANTLLIYLHSLYWQNTPSNIHASNVSAMRTASDLQCIKRPRTQRTPSYDPYIPCRRTI